MSATTSPTSTAVNWFAPVPAERILPGDGASVLVRAEYELPKRKAAGENGWLGYMDVRLYEGWTNVNSIADIVRIHIGAKSFDDFQITNIAFFHGK